MAIGGPVDRDSDMTEHKQLVKFSYMKVKDA